MITALVAVVLCVPGRVLVVSLDVLTAPLGRRPNSRSSGLRVVSCDGLRREASAAEKLSSPTIFPPNTSSGLRYVSSLLRPVKSVSLGRRLSSEGLRLEVLPVYPLSDGRSADARPEALAFPAFREGELDGKSGAG
jgi:hypothetical protein